MFTDKSAGLLTGAGMQNVCPAGLDALAGILIHWHRTCWEARLKPVRFRDELYVDFLLSQSLFKE